MLEGGSRAGFRNVAWFNSSPALQLQRLNWNSRNADRVTLIRLMQQSKQSIQGWADELKLNAEYTTTRYTVALTLAEACVCVQRV